MYHAIVRRKVEKLFEGLGRGDGDYAVAGMAPRFEHIFPGDHAHRRRAPHASWNSRLARAERRRSVNSPATPSLRAPAHRRLQQRILLKKFTHPIDEHTHLRRKVAALRIHDEYGKLLRGPVGQHLSQLS